MHAVIIGKFSEGNSFTLIILILINEEPEVLLNFLVDSFALAISLWGEVITTVNLADF